MIRLEGKLIHYRYVDYASVKSLWTFGDSLPLLCRFHEDHIVHAKILAMTINIQQLVLLLFQAYLGLIKIFDWFLVNIYLALVILKLIDSIQLVFEVAKISVTCYTA